MKPLDIFIQRLRINKTKEYVPANSRLLDIGCAGGAIFLQLQNKIREGVGIDPGIQNGFKGSNFQIICGKFPGDIPAGETNFDAVTMLAVLEHIPMSEQPLLAQNIHKHLNDQGVLIITVPSPNVDKVLKILLSLRLIDGMALDEHFGFDVKTVVSTFTNHGFELVEHKYFQFGLNNIFVFKKQ
jgi:SAM-dependent methyltransferase